MTSRTPAQSWASSAAVRQVMRGNRKRDTGPELAVRRAAHGLGLRYRVSTRPLRGRSWTGDLVFAGRRVAVFIDGCYWHGCPEHYTAPRTNSSYWAPKIERNRARDAIVDAELTAAGWTSVRLWEHESVDAAVARIVTALGRT